MAKSRRVSSSSPTRPTAPAVDCDRNCSRRSQIPPEHTQHTPILLSRLILVGIYLTWLNFLLHFLLPTNTFPPQPDCSPLVISIHICSFFRKPTCRHSRSSSWICIMLYLYTILLAIRSYFVDPEGALTATPGSVRHDRHKWRVSYKSETVPGIRSPTNAPFSMPADAAGDLDFFSTRSSVWPIMSVVTANRTEPESNSRRFNPQSNRGLWAKCNDYFCFCWA